MGQYPAGDTPEGLWGLSDGNAERVQDWYSDKYHGASPPTNRAGPSSGSQRVCKGGYNLSYISYTKYFAGRRVGRRCRARA